MAVVGRPQSSGILILDYGSQYTLLIARRLREIGVYSEIIQGDAPTEPEGFTCRGIILSGGPDSVTAEDAKALPSWVESSQLPVLGICYGMQLLNHTSQGVVQSGKRREYGRAKINLATRSKLFNDIPESFTVWMSHGDDVKKLAKGFTTVATTEDGVTAAVHDESRNYYGLQFHPEVLHTEYGPHILKNFVEGICDAALNWQSVDMLEGTEQFVREKVGDGKVLMAVSGGVDSTVAAVLMSRALGSNHVLPVFVDTGLLRKNEGELVRLALHRLGLDNLVVLERQREFISALHGVSDPEQKRKIIGRKFIEEFERFASNQQRLTHLGQGTLYPDVIESAGHGFGAKVIKTHHNVGGLPEKLNLTLVEPFRYCFKDEVRKIGRELGLPETIVGRHPFPGPGLGVRIPGEITAEKIEMLQEADDIYIRMLRENGYYDKVWQAFAVLLPVKSVGVMGDNRSYQWTCALRAVTGTDAMTAGVADLPMEFLTAVSDQIVRQVDGINRIVYDVTTKPPATIEWE